MMSKLLQILVVDGCIRFVLNHKKKSIHITERNVRQIKETLIGKTPVRSH